MDVKQSLKKRIVVVFALMSTCVAVVFATGIVATVHVVERDLAGLSLVAGLHHLLVMNSTDEWHHQLEKDELFFAQDGKGDLRMPAALLALAPGFQEVELDNGRYYAQVQRVDGRTYVLLRNQHAQQRRERVLFFAVGGCLLLSMVLAVGLGWLLARHVISPVTRLAGQVRHRDRLLALAPPLAPDYAADEVGELAHSFDNTLSRLRAALTREQAFTSDVSYELRLPLTTLASSTSALLDVADLDASARRQATRIARATDNMLHLVDTFLLLARVDEQSVAQGNSSPIRQVANEQAELWGKHIRDKGLEFFYQDNEEAVPAPYNHTLLSSVMGNLLRNAWHYTDHGWITLSLTKRGFTVEDTGIGIPKEKQQAMFQPFVRGDEQRGEGLGLGLSLVQRICKNQGWEVRLSNRQPHGCRFSVDLISTQALL